MRFISFIAFLLNPSIMKNNYFNSLILGMMCLTIYSSQSQNILYDGDFSLTTEIIPFDTPTPPINTWAYFLNFANGVEANPTVVGGVCNYQITNPGNNTWEVQLAQWGFPLILGHSYQLLFDVKADADRSFGVYLGEDEGNWIDLIGYDRYIYNATTEWQTISVEFEAFSVFPLHKLSFELGGDNTTTYFDNIILQDLGPAPPEKIVIAGAFQSALNCANDWDPNCDYTELIFNSSTGLYAGTFQIPEGKNRYKVTVGGSWDINYGENGILNGADIFLCLPSGSEEITFTYDPSTNLVTTSPITSGFSPDCLPMVVLAGSFQDELGCYGDWVPDCTNTALIYNSDSELFEADLNIPTGCYDYRVVLENSWENSFGQEGIHNGPNYTISIPANPDITHFTYDPVSHIVSSTPYSGAPQEATKISFNGTLQNELGCAYDYEYECDNPALLFNPDSGEWEGNFTLPAGCYTYQVKETIGCNNITFYGENGLAWGNAIQLYVPSDGEIKFSYDPQTHIMSSTPYSGAPQEVTKVTLYGTLQNELSCAYDYEYDCDNPALLFNSDSGAWEGNFTLPAGCYTYQVKETFGCIVTIYGENGIEGGNEIQLYVPLDGEITFSYDPQTHIMSSTPYSGAPQEVTKVSLYGTLQDELGCASDYDYECNNSALVFNSDSGAWAGSFTLPTGCYSYLVKETFGCNNVSFYGQNGEIYGNYIELYVPSGGEIIFSYDPQTHIMSSTPYSGAPQEVTKVSLYGTLQEELGCASDYEDECDNSALLFDPDSSLWTGSFTLPAGCYAFRVKETFGCNNVTFYGENGIEWGKFFELYVPSDSEITFSYDPQTHILSSTPYSGADLAKISLIGTLQDELGCAYDSDYECDNPALVFNSDTGAWAGSFTLPSGCYTYRIQETDVCDNVTFYGENGIEWGNEIQLYVPSDSEITFSYDPQTHIMSSTPFSGAPQEATKVSLIGTLQDELGCAYDYDYGCDNPKLLFNSDSAAWAGSFMLPAGCYTYRVKETSVCSETFYGENGIEWGNEIQLYVPSDGEITFSYDPQTHIMSSTPNSGAKLASKVSLIGTFQDELGCASDYDYGCDNPALLFNSDSGAWAGSFTFPAGCYTYQVKETSVCNNVTFYGENGIEWGNAIQLYVPSDGEITFSYDPQTHIMSSTPYTDISTLNQCPNNISVNNSPGTCGAIVNYPEFVATANCGGEFLSITQTEGLPSGSFFPVGITTNSYLLTKTTGEEITCSFDVVIKDTESPVISELNQNYEPLWPPNHKMVPVFLEYLVSDNCNIPSAEISIASNEPENGPGTDQAPDWEILDEHNVLLRAERFAKGDGREYYITIKVTDSSGNYTEQFVTVTVPRNGNITQTEPGNYKYTLYPNATDDIINIKGPKSTSNSPYVIYDMLGVMKKQGIINNEPIEVRTLPSGVYIFKLETAEGCIFKKFIKN